MQTFRAVSGRSTLVSLLAVVLTLAVIGIAPSSSGRDATHRATSLSVSPASPMAGERTVFSGQVPGARRPVRLERRTPAGWRVVDRARSSSTGRYSLSTRVPRTTRYRVYAPRAGNRGPVTAGARLVRVARQRAMVAGIDRPFVVGLSRAVTARVLPARAGRWVLWQRRGGGRWTTVARARSNGVGVARIPSTGTSAGNHAYRVVGAPFRGARAVTSSPSAVRTARRIELASTGTPAGEESYGPSVSADGRWLGFTSTGRLLPSDTDDQNDAYLFDRRTGKLTHLLPAANSHTSNPVLSANGRYVALQTLASNVGETDSDYDYDVYVLDRATGVLDLVSRATDGTSGNNDSFVYALSDDGRFVAYTSRASDLVSVLPPPNTSLLHPYLHDRTTDLNRGLDRIAGGWSTNNVYGLDVSADGSMVVFASNDPDLDPGDVDGSAVHAWDVAADGAISNRRNLTPDANASAPRLDGDGNLMVFSSNEALAPVSDLDSDRDAYLRAASGDYVLAGPAATGPSEAWDISATGRFVAVATESTVDDDTNGTDHDVLVWDRSAGTWRLVTRGGPGDSAEAQLSASGSVAGIGSAADLAPGAPGTYGVFAAVLR